MAQQAQSSGSVAGKHAAPVFPNLRRRSGEGASMQDRGRPTDSAVIFEWDAYYEGLSTAEPAQTVGHKASPTPARRAEEPKPIPLLQIVDKGRTMRATSALLYSLTTIIIITPDIFGLSARTHEPAVMPVAVVAPMQVQADTLRSRLRAYTDAEVAAFQQSVRGMSDLALGQVIEDAWSKALIPGHMLADFFHDMALLAEAERASRIGRN